MEWLFKNCFQPIHNVMNEMGDELYKIMTQDYEGFEGYVEGRNEESVIVKMEEIENLRKRIVLENSENNQN